MKKTIKEALDNAIDFADSTDMIIEEIGLCREEQNNLVKEIYGKDAFEKCTVILHRYRNKNIVHSDRRFSITMVSKLLPVLLLLLTLASCSPRLGRTVAKGEVIHTTAAQTEPYKVLIKDYDRKTGAPSWIRWEPWELQNDYILNVETNDVIECLWISLCDGDTLARLTVYGDYGKRKIKRDILLDGTHYVLGSSPFDEPLNAKK